MLADLQACKPLWEVKHCPKNNPWHGSLLHPLAHNPKRGCSSPWLGGGADTSPQGVTHPGLAHHSSVRIELVHFYRRQINDIDSEMTLFLVPCLIKTNKCKKAEFCTYWSHPTWARPCIRKWKHLWANHLQHWVHRSHLHSPRNARLMHGPTGSFVLKGYGPCICNDFFLSLPDL